MAEQLAEMRPITKSVRVGVGVERAFELFTAGVGTWWPLETHSVSESRAETVVLEGRQGGRLYERTSDGEEHLWGTVVVWEPPRRLVYTWHPGRGEETRQDVEMSFTPDGDGTRVDVEHRGWERLGDEAPAAMRSYDSGWDYVLGECYAGRVADAGP